MIALYSILAAFLFLLPVSDGKKFLIMDLNSNYILIDSKPMQEGDVFDDGASVWWCFKGQTMVAMDINTSKMYKFSAVNSGSNSPETSDFWGVEKPLSTNAGATLDTSAEAKPYFYITYSQNGGVKKEVLHLNIDLQSLPDGLSLYYYDPVSGSDEFQTDDFRGFLKNLTTADRMAKTELSKKDYYEGEEQKLVNDYMALMQKYVSQRFKDIDYTYKELKLFLKL